MRGKLTGKLSASCRQGITPAGAGKTPESLIPTSFSKDHPRRCGENRMGRCYSFKKLGSPPQVRGKRRYLFLKAVRYRITPAGAGKTKKQEAGNYYIKDHPRRCGENRPQRLSAMSALGSPPQVRGKHEGSGTNIYSSGITPAGAGKTLKRSFRNQPFCS